MQLNPRLHDFGEGITRLPLPDPDGNGWLTSSFVRLLIDVDGKTYARDIQIGNTPALLEKLGFAEWIPDSLDNILSPLGPSSSALLRRSVDAVQK